MIHATNKRPGLRMSSGKFGLYEFSEREMGHSREYGLTVMNSSFGQRLQDVPQQKQDDRRVHQTYVPDEDAGMKPTESPPKVYSDLVRHRLQGQIRARRPCPQDPAECGHPHFTPNLYLTRVQGKLGGLGETPSKKFKLVPSGKDLLEVSKKDDNTDEIAGYCEMTKFLGVGMSASSALGSD
ncbi:hypothetical protein BDR06DRAFT_976580 [Suillus hirtellus]|nr:hypothetical protein BDR06DRAFT_976580 [Suillus hirtellus]